MSGEHEVESYHDDTNEEYEVESYEDDAYEEENIVGTEDYDGRADVEKKRKIKSGGR